MVFAYWLLMTLASLPPLVGVAIAPVLGAGVLGRLHGGGRVASRQRPAARARAHLRRLSAAGCFAPSSSLASPTVACSPWCLSATTLADNGALARWMTTAAASGRRTLLQSDRAILSPRSPARRCSTFPVDDVIFWFAPPLAAWHATGTGKALFFSFFACLMNWRASSLTAR